MVRKLQQQLNTDGTPFLTEFEIPVLVQTEDLYVCDASTIYSPVSIALALAPFHLIQCFFLTIYLILYFV